MQKEPAHATLFLVHFAFNNYFFIRRKDSTFVLVLKT